MRKLFARVTGSVTGTKRELDQDSQDSSTSARLSRSTSASLVLTEETRNLELAAECIFAAAQSLLTAVQEILYDTASLQENLSGFIKLLSILDDTMRDSSSLSIEVKSSLETLLQNLKHPMFAEKCNETGLATALMHALRLLRMYEIKLAKSSNLAVVDDSMRMKKVPTQGVTFVASKRLCLVFSTLLTDHRTTEKIRSSLVKLVTFPLSALPEQGLHLQLHSSTIISSMCKSGLSLQQVSFLHDLQAVTHMIRSLDALSSVVNDESKPASPSGDEHLLRGMFAETAGMWVISLNCLVDIIVSATSSVSSLMDEFDASGGKGVLVQMLTGCSSYHLMPLMTSISRLFFDPKKPEIISQPSIGGIFIDYLKELFGLRRGIGVEDDVHSLYDISSHLVSSSKRLVGKEHIIQSVGYLLLTIYSSDPLNCDILEESYHFLSLLIVSLPALDGWDSISAVLTTLNYVCQCIDSETEMPIVALCAAMSVMTKNALYGDSSAVRDKALQQLDATCSSFEAIIRGQPKYALIIVKCGMLKWVLCDALRGFLHVHMLPVYGRVIDFVIAVHKKGPPDAAVIQKSGLLPVLHKILSSNHGDSNPPVLLTQRLLMLMEELVAADSSHLQEVFRFIIRLLDILVPAKPSAGSRSSVKARSTGNVERIVCLCDSLCRMIDGRNKATSVWRDLEGLQWLISLIGRLEGTFTSLPGVSSPASSATNSGSNSPNVKSRKPSVQSSPRLSKISATAACRAGGGDGVQTHSLVGNTASLIGTIFSLMNCIAIDFTINSTIDRRAKDFQITHAIFRRNFSLLADALIATNIFCSAHAESGLHAVFGLLKGHVNLTPQGVLVAEETVLNSPASSLVCSSSGRILVPEAARIVLEMLLRLPSNIGVRAINILHALAESTEEGCQLLCDADICQHTIKRFYSLIATKNESQPHRLGASLYNLVRTLMIGYLRARDFSSLLYYLMRPEVVPDPRGYALLPPWIAGEEQAESTEELAHRRWKTLDLLLDIQKVSGSADSQAVPHVALGGEAAPYLTVQLAEPKSFPQSAFTFSAWLRINSPGGSAEVDCIPILSLASATGCILEVHWEVHTRLVRVAVCKRELVSVLHFQLPVSLTVNTNAWNVLVVAVHAKKQVMKGADRSAKSAVCLFFNGLPCQPVGAHLIGIDIPASPISLSVGYFDMNFVGAQDEGTKEDVKLRKFRQPAWGLGPVLLWDDSLSSIQLSLIFLRGPAYTGTFQAESPLSDYLASVSCDLLRRCDLSGTHIEEYTKELGLQGLESVVDPPVEHLSKLVSSFDLPVLPPAFLAYSAQEFNIIRTVTNPQPLTRPQSPRGGPEPFEYTSPPVCGVDISLQSFHQHGGTNITPVANITEGAWVAQPATLATCIANLGGPSVLFPMVQASVSDEQLIGTVKLIRCSALGNDCNLKYLQVKGYRILGYLLSIKNKDLISMSLMDELFEFSISRGSASNQCSDSISSILLVDTPALYYLLLNHQIWALKRYPYTRKVVSYLDILSSNPFHGDLNNQRLAALGVLRWCLMGAVYSAHECSTHTASALCEKRPLSQPSRTDAPSSTRDRDGGKGDKEVGAGSLDSWQLSLYRSDDVINEEDQSDPYLSSVCAIVKRVVLAEVQRKDLEMISNVILYTLSCRERTPSTARKSDCKARSDAMSHSMGDLDGHKLPPLSMLRVYLLRLLFVMYDEHINKIVLRNSSLKNESKDKEKIQGYAEREREKERERERNESSLSCSASVMAFRISFHPEWFLNVFEKCLITESSPTNQAVRGDSATHCLTLRLLALMLQSDSVALKEFCAKDGMRYLRSLLLPQVDLSDVITLLGMFFRIPLHLLPLPCQLYVDPATSDRDRARKGDKAPGDKVRKGGTRASNLTVLLNLKECLGPDLSDSGLKEFSLPLLEILFECLTTAAGASEGPSYRGRHEVEEIKSVNPENKVRDTILSTLSQAYYTLPSFRRLMQQKVAVQALMTTMVFFSDASIIPVGERIVDPPGRSDSDLPGALREDHFSVITPIYSPTTTTPIRGIESKISKNRNKSESENSLSGTIASRGEPTGESSLFRASANWDNLFTQNSASPSHPQSGTPPHGSEHHAGGTDLDLDSERPVSEEISLTEEGTTLLQLLSSVISSAITEFENAGVLCAMLLSLPTVGSSQVPLQLLVVQSFREVVQDLFENYFDPNISKKSKNVLVSLSGALNYLTPLFRCKIFAPATNFEILKLTLLVLVKSYDLYSVDAPRSADNERPTSLELVDRNTFSIKEKERERERERERKERNKMSALLIAKDLGKSGRFFAATCLLAVEEAEFKMSIERLAPTECLGNSSAILRFIRENLTLLLQPNLFTDKEDFEFSPLVVIRTTRKEKDGNDDKPSSSILNLDSFRLNWAGSYEDSTSGHSRRNSNENFGLDIALTQASSMGEKQRCSEAFCMILLKRCLQCITVCSAPPPTPTSTRPGSPRTIDPPSSSSSPLSECCRILTLLYIHRHSLVELLMLNAQKATLAALSHGQGKSVKENDSQKLDDEGEDGNPIETPEQMFLNGLSLLLPEDGDYMSYEQFLANTPAYAGRGGLEIGLDFSAKNQRAAEETRESRFYSWLLSNRMQALKGLAPLITYVQSIHPSEQEVVEETKAIWCNLSAKPKDRSTSPSRGILSSVSAATSASLLYLSPGKRSDDIQKLGDLIAMQARRWLVFGFVHISSGAFAWIKAWGALQAGPLWGYQPPPLTASSSLESEGPLHLADSNEGALKRWSLARSEGPERARIKMHQEFGPSVPLKSKGDGLSKSVRKGEAVSAKVTEGSSKSTAPSEGPLSAKEAGDMEGFLKEVTEKGLIRKTSTVVPFGDLENIVVEPDRVIKDLFNAQGSGEDISEGFERGMSLGDLADRGDIDSENSDSDDSNEEAEIIFSSTHIGSTDSEDHKKGGPSSASELLSGWYFAPKDKVRLDSHQHGLKGDTEVFKRSAMLVELVKGAIGGTDWHQGKKYNVQRISGLESQSALVVLTRTNLHILTGFRVKSVGAGLSTGASGAGGTKAGEGRVVVEWVASMGAATAAKDAVLSAAAGSTTSTSTSSAASNVSSTSSGSGFSYSSTFDRVTKPIPTLGKDASPAMKRTALAASEAAYAAASVSLGGSTAQHIGEVEWLSSIWKEVLSTEDGYRCLPLDEVYTVFKRRHQLKYTALRVTDTSGCSLLFSCDSEAKCDEVLLRLFEADMPASLFHQVIGIKNLQLLRGLSNMYNRLMALFLSTATSKWLKGEISNFDYLMHLNIAAGRSYQDLTQYPVFPWILADYSSEILDLNDPKSFRDLSKPMGALGLKRAKQYRDRYRTMDDFRRNGIEGTPPPFYYGTHYSCAGYVLHYLLRLQPFSNMAIALQGGQFDKPDRLFMSIEQSWLSASSMNLQDVRELIPEFFCLPDFLLNKNKFDLGHTQKGDEVCDVQLPLWAKGNPSEFIRRNREALESKFVSENLHEWIDLIFGFKQRGPAAEEAMNVFIHLTYDGEVDADAITDPVLRDATIAQINNFGQTPTKLFDKPHPKKTVPDLLRRTPTDVLAVDAPALQWHEQSVLTPPLCMAGATHLTTHIRMSYNLAAYPAVCGNRGPCAVGDIQLFSKDKLLSLPSFCHFLSPATGSKKMVQFGGSGGGISIHSVTAGTRNGTLDDREGTYHERLHDGVVTCVCTGRAGTKDILATGSDDSTIRLWGTAHLADKHRIEHLHTLSGHSDIILCIDLSAQYHVLLSGSADCTAALWDIREGKLLRVLGKHESPVISVSINPVSGHTLTLSCAELRIYSINGDALGAARIGPDPQKFPSFPPSLSTAADKRDVTESPQRRKTAIKEAVAASPTPTTWGRVVLAPPCSGWQDGVVAVTGHDSGQVCFWRMQSLSGVKGSMRQLVAIPLSLSAAQSASQAPSQFQTPSQIQKRIHTHLHTHNAAITVLRLCPIASSKSKDFSDKCPQGGPMDLLVGDGKGFVSAWTLLKLDHFSPAELGLLVSLKPPPSREVPSSGSAGGTTLAGAANAFAPLGASGLLKLLGAGGIVSGNNSHSSHHSHHETASALAARIQEIEDLSNDDNMEEFF